MIFSRLLTLLAIASAAVLPLRAAENDQEVEAHKTALELAGAFSNDGFKIRDGHWSGALKRGEQAVIVVNLYAGNQYWFSVGADGAKKFPVRLYDETGKPLATENYEDEEKAAAGFAPTVSGQYFVAIGPIEQDNAGTFSLVYSYR
ncbi:MAG: hypothetical protein M3032_12765 [Verrucomicrobiota bacterium]|nr:hypothetical protein [Verrucomicrobiota bacterium]